MAEPSLPDPSEDDLPEPAPLRALRRSVMFLTSAAAIAVLAVAGALVIRAVRPAAAPQFDLSAVAAGAVTAPAGEEIVAAGAAPGAVILVTRDRDWRERLRFFDARTGAAGPVVAVERRP